MTLKPIQHDIVVIGASAGSLPLLIELVAALPAGFPAAIFIVTHTSAQNPSRLSEILDNHSPLPATKSILGEPIRTGQIYMPQPTRHLLLKNGHIRLTFGPVENFSRPAIDSLFRSAAYHYGPRAIGIILSGLQQDGAIGLRLIKEYGGLTIVQHPQDADYPSMPLQALKRLGDNVDYVLKAADISAVLRQLVQPGDKPLLRSFIQNGQNGQNRMNRQNGQNRMNSTNAPPGLLPNDYSSKPPFTRYRRLSAEWDKNDEP
jgi:two-component system chemotaxis response regulator CheB